ncbi:thioredoxin domain-containing protein [Arthrobacter sp. LAPM80]|uniref:DsbA family protein n=1 Tax=Arthrobacter sp. LAPM80 TaxID=3141788 RepID=UPI00398A9CA6
MNTKKMGTNKTRNVVLALVLGVVVVLTIVFVGAAANENRLNAAAPHLRPPAPTAGGNGPAGEFTLERRIAADPMSIGAVDAPVVMIEYSDFRCPFCGVYARKTQPEIIKKYVDAGQLRIEWRDLPVLGEASVNAAVAARAAGAQDLFWQFNEAVYTAAPEKGHSELTEPELLKFAKQVGVPDMVRFAADMKSPELLALVKADLAEGTGLGLNSTPTFVINNQSIPGAQPMEVFTQVIDEALAKAK